MKILLICAKWSIYKYSNEQNAKMGQRKKY